MDARQCYPESTLSKLHEHASSLPPSARPEALLCQLQCPAKPQNSRKPVKYWVVCTADTIVSLRMSSNLSLMKLTAGK